MCEVVRILRAILSPIAAAGKFAGGVSREMGKSMSQATATPRPSKRNHYVPKFLQEYFVGDDGTLWVYDKDGGDARPVGGKSEFKDSTWRHAKEPCVRANDGTVKFSR